MPPPGSESCPSRERQGSVFQVKSDQTVFLFESSGYKGPMEVVGVIPGLASCAGTFTPFTSIFIPSNQFSRVLYVVTCQFSMEFTFAASITDEFDQPLEALSLQPSPSKPLCKSYMPRVTKGAPCFPLFSCVRFFLPLQRLLCPFYPFPPIFFCLLPDEL